MASLAIDTDALLMLLALDSVDDALNLLGVSREECFRLKSLEHQLRKSRSRKRFSRVYPNLDLDVALSLVESLQSTPVPSNIQLQKKLAEIDGIDEGEVLLLASTVEEMDQIILSGDKRMLVALGKHNDDPMIANACQRLEKKVVYLPDLVAALTRDNSVGLAEMDTRWRTSECGHMTLSIMFTSGQATERSICEGWEYALYDVKDALGDKFLLELYESSA